MRSYSMVERMGAEVVGTFLLVVLGGGTGAIANIIAPGNAAGLLLVALAHGLALLLAVYLYGKVSGAHVNPAITISLAATKNFPWKEVLPYIVAQLIGAVLGSAVDALALGHLGVVTGHLGATTLAAGVGPGQGFAAEAFGAAVLAMAVAGGAFDPRAKSETNGLIIGFALAAIIMTVGAISGASVNPARTFGPDVVLSILGQNGGWEQYWIYIFGPVIGAVIGALVYTGIAKPYLVSESK